MENTITEQKLEKYFKITRRALEKVKNKIAKGKEKEAAEIIEMVSCYLNDAEWFFKKGDFVNAFAALNYSHGWLDAGARLRIFNVRDNKMFTIE